MKKRNDMLANLVQSKSCNFKCLSSLTIASNKIYRNDLNIIYLVQIFCLDRVHLCHSCGRTKNGQGSEQFLALPLVLWLPPFVDVERLNDITYYYLY